MLNAVEQFFPESGILQDDAGAGEASGRARRAGMRVRAREGGRGRGEGLAMYIGTEYILLCSERTRSERADTAQDDETLRCADDEIGARRTRTSTLLGEFSQIKCCRLAVE